MAASGNLRIDGDRLWSTLMEMAAIGATPKGGVCRLALSDLDRQGRDLFVSWCRDAGLTVRVDAIGNIFARRAGRDDSLPAVMTGSHLDSQPTGGKFDGAYGVLAGLEVIRSLNDLGLETEAPVEIVAWTNEEGARFAPAMMGSGVYAGVLDLAATQARQDLEGKTVAEELARIGYAGEAAMGRPKPGAYFEAHIEQGPILERDGKPIGVVTGAQGIRWYDIHVTGQDSHAGTTPMSARKDALVGAARIVDGFNALGLANLPDARLTVGQLVVKPNSRNVIPGAVSLSLDLRHPDSATLDRLEREAKELVARVCDSLGLESRIEAVEKAAPVAFNASCVAAVRDAAKASGLAHRDMASGAGHDACHVAKIAPAAMIFVPCEKGLSHNELESATAADLARGCEVLLRAVLAFASPCPSPQSGEGTYGAIPMKKLRLAPLSLIVALVCGGLGWVVRYLWIEPAEMGAACERANLWWCPLRLNFIYFHQAYGMAWGALVLAGLAVVLPRRFAPPAVIGAMVVAGLGLVLYNTAGAAVALVIALVRAAWLDRASAAPQRA